MNKISNEQKEGEKIARCVKWVSWLFLAVSILMLIFTYYRAEILYKGTLSAHYFKYYIFSLAGILFWILVLRLKDKTRANIVMVSISLTAGLYLAEGVLTFFDMFPPVMINEKAAAEQNIPFDSRTELEVVLDMRSAGKGFTTPAFYPRTVLLNKTLHKYGTGLLLPFGGISNTTTVDRNESGKYYIHKSDRYGFKNPDAEWDSPQVEWLLVGDSFTYGLPVKMSEGIPGQIRQITNTSVINLGAVGNGPLIELATLKEYAESIRPRKVIWIYCEVNDLFGDLQSEQKYPLLMQYLSDGFSQNLMGRQKEINSRLDAYFLDALVQNATRTMQLGKIQKLMQIDDSHLDVFFREALVRHAKRITRLGKIRDLKKFVSKKVVSPIASLLLFTKILNKARERTEAWGGGTLFCIPALVSSL